MEKMISIGEAAKKMNVSIDTLRRWDKKGRFSAVRKSGKRFYRESDIEDFVNNERILASDILKIARKWALSQNAFEPEEVFYCQNVLVLQSKLVKLEGELGKIIELKDTYPLIVAMAGEIGNNSFDHNLGNWPDVPGIFFGYDLIRREIVLADRGQGILNTLKRVKKDLTSDEQALKVAFSEIISGRAPEARGNGLKFVKNIVVENDFKLVFESGNAMLELEKSDKELDIRTQEDSIQGCLVHIKF